MEELKKFLTTGKNVEQAQQLSAASSSGEAAISQLDLIHGLISDPTQVTQQDKPNLVPRLAPIPVLRPTNNAGPSQSQNPDTLGLPHGNVAHPPHCGDMLPTFLGINEPPYAPRDPVQQPHLITYDVQRTHQVNQVNRNRNQHTLKPDRMRMDPIFTEEDQHRWGDQLVAQDYGYDGWDPPIHRYQDDWNPPVRRYQEAWDPPARRYQDDWEALRGPVRHNRDRGHHRGYQEDEVLNAGDFQRMTRMGKLDFPRFDGTSVEDWLFKADNYFEIDGTPLR